MTSHGESLATEHAAADGRIEAALSGWRGLSSAALTAKSTAWLQITSELLVRISDHAQRLHDGAQTYADGEEHSSAQLQNVAVQAAHRS